MLSMHPLDLEAISSKIWNSSYNKKRLPAIIIRKTKPRATVLLFRTGRGLIIGAETVQNLEQVAKKMAKEMTMIMNAGKIELIEIAVTNVMGVGTLGTSAWT
jgi:TATA-box binding protein (TBP) (component of TFIID and TFIIIB)